MLSEERGGFFSFMRRRLFGNDDWADQSEGAADVPVQDLDLSLVMGDQLVPRLSWLGHSTFLVQYGEVNILTDPTFSDRASPFSFLGPKRYVRHVVDYDKLPDIDVVVISHNHYDHLDEDTLRGLGDGPLYFVPLGLRDLLLEFGISPERVVEMDWWDEYKGDEYRVTATPAQHWSARWLDDRYQTLWSSWYIKIGDFSMWFAGDTGYNPYQFAEIGEYTGGVDLALIPVGAYLPRSVMEKHHVNGKEAVNVHRDVGSRFSVGMHWGTFPLTAEPTMEPPAKLLEALHAAGIHGKEFVTLAIGQSVVVDIQNGCQSEVRETACGELAR